MIVRFCSLRTLVNTSREYLGDVLVTKYSQDASTNARKLQSLPSNYVNVTGESSYTDNKYSSKPIHTNSLT